MQLVQTAQLLHHSQSQNNKIQFETLLVWAPELIPLVVDTTQPPLLIKCHCETLGTRRLHQFHLKILIGVCSSGFLLIVSLDLLFFIRLLVGLLFESEIF